MGNLLQISLDDQSDRINYFNTLLDVGGTVRDVVRFGLASKGTRSWVCTMVATLDQPSFRALLTSLPYSDYVNDFRHRFDKSAMVYFQPESVLWVSSHSYDIRHGSTVLIEPIEREPNVFTQETVHYLRLGRIMYDTYTPCTNELYYYVPRSQWYPMLNDAIDVTAARYRTYVPSPKVAEYAQDMYLMRVNHVNKQ
jgi:hypothetical protein